MHNQPNKTVGYLEYIFKNSFLTTVNHVLRVLRYMKTKIKKCFKSKWLFIKVKLFIELTNNSWCKIGPHKTIGFFEYISTRS